MKQPGRMVLVLGVVFVIMAGACAAPPPSAPAPTLAPPTLAPTVAAPTPTPVPPTLAPTVVPPTLAPTTDAFALLKTFQDAFNKGDTDRLMALFAEDPTFTLLSGLFGAGELMGSTATTKAVRDILEIGFELNSQLTASDCSTKNNQATCALVIKDDCNPPAAAAYHIRAQFVFEDGKIASVYGRWDSNEENAFRVYNSARQDWARQNLPADAAAYDAYNSANSAELGLTGLAPGETASEYGQAVERICKGYTATGH